MALKVIVKSAIEWIDQRYQIRDLIEFMKKKDVPLTRLSVWYYFGGLSLFLFIVQVVTGILLLMYYSPSADTAYESVKFIVSQVNFGWLVRSIHVWSANLFILCIFIHFFSVFFMKAYKKPRELTWISGFALLALALGFGFSGYLLPWNTRAFFATKVGTEIVGAVPVVGPVIMRVLRGGAEVSGATLSRFFGFHVAILPGITTLLLSLHLLFVQRQGMSKPLDWERHPERPHRTMPFFPDFLLRDMLLWLVVLYVVIALSIFIPSELGSKADLFAPAPAGIKPEWYFLSMFQTLKFFPAKILGLPGDMLAIVGFGVVGLVVLLVPVLDRRLPRYERSKVVDALGVFALVYFIVMTILGFIIQ